MTDFGQFHVRKWDVQFYQDQTRKWLTGSLCVTVEGIDFRDKNSPFSVGCRYGEFGDVKKTTTGILFGAIVITTKSGQKLWFSSLPNREDIYNVIEYFLRSNVTFSDKEHLKSTGQVSKGTEMGRKLLKVVHDSHQTLNASANLLSSQGDQIDSTLTAMVDIQNDLDIAENLTSGMENWLGKWKIPEVYQKVDPVIINNRDIPEISQYEILYTKIEINKMSTQKLGLLRIASEGVFILSDKQKLIHHFKWSDISRVRVLSPCEIVVTRFLIGQPDLSFGVVCTSLLGFVEFLEKRLRSKVEYITSGFVKQESDNYGHTKTKMDPTQFGCKKGELLTRNPTTTSIPQLHTSFDKGQTEGDIKGDQLQISHQVVSDAEVQEIQQTLTDLRSLALAAQQETNIQNEKLDTLTTSVDKANLRITDVNSRLAKLMK